MIFQSPFERSEAGFTLIEILMTMALVAILSVGGISLLTGSVDENRFDATVKEMEQFRNALVGNAQAVQGGSRSGFGFAGDMGSLPSALSSVISLPPGAQAFITNSRIGLGWNGPYLQSGISGKSPLVDSWGHNYQWQVSGAGDGILTSFGADGASGGTVYNQDIVINIPSSAYRSTIYGFISDGGGPLAGSAQVEINFPDGSGRLQQSLVTVAAGSQGAFQFNQIPQGQRSISIYVPTKAAPTKTIGPLVFVVDKPRFLVPVNFTDVNPSGAGGGAGAAAGTCATNSGFISLKSGNRRSSGTQIDFTVNASQNISVSAVKATVPTAALVEEVKLNSTRYRCTGTRRLTPCPNASANMALSPAYNLRRGDRDVEIDFSSSVNAVDSIDIVFTHSGGCDSISVTGLN